ncbi:MAG: hypothetical protein Sapg2KO_53470 [Saprospiraceae bacterium]
MNKTIWLLCLTLSTTYLSIAQSAKDSLNLELTQIMKASRLPGLGLSIADKTGVLYANGFGYSNLEEQIKYDAHTVQHVASISKTFIGMALMQLVEAGKLSLEDEINDLLPFQVINPHFPQHEIKLIHLVTHSSGIQETDEMDNSSYFIKDRTASKSDFPKGYYKFYKKYLKNKHLSYSEYVQLYLATDGEKYSPNNFGDYQPGTQFAYTNIGACLAAYIVELVSGQSFISYTQSHITGPLGMKNTAWDINDITSTNKAQPYFQNGSKAPAYQLISYPSGGLHTSSYDIGLYMAEIMNGYLGKGSLLSAKSYQILLSNQISSDTITERNGVFWNINGEDNIGHGGAEIGAACNVLFSPQLGKTIFVMVNISSFEEEELERDYIKILIAVSKFARQISR